MHTSAAYVSIRQHTSAYVSIRAARMTKLFHCLKLLVQKPCACQPCRGHYARGGLFPRQHTAAYVSSIRSRRSLPSSAYGSIRQQYTSAYVRIAPVSRVVAVSLETVASLVSISARGKLQLLKCQNTAAYGSIRQHQHSSIRQHQRQRQAAGPGICTLALANLSVFVFLY